MVDFRKRIAVKETSKKIDPIEIYDSLDRASDKGPLRPAQQSILESWYKNHKEDKDVIIKLHTGQGKTLIGLLILQSKINEGLGPAIFICPNILLADQTCEQAKQFGIKYCRVAENNHLPEDFTEGKSILITHVQKIFTGFSIFGIGKKYLDVKTLVLDDSHACIDHIQNAMTIKISKEDPTYHRFIQLFESDLEIQGYAKLEEIKTGVYNTILPVPYWAWNEKYKEVITLLVNDKDKNHVKFAWNLMQDEIKSCSCIISANVIEIIPYNIPIEQFGSFTNASTRIFMSATTNNDSFFLKGLGVNKKSIQEPLIYEKEKWSGEKMILIPSLIQDEITRIVIVNSFAIKNKNNRGGVVVLTPSFNISNFWEECGATVAKKNIAECVKKLKDGNYAETIVFANRYDGIDLPDDMCRVLIIDQKPYAQSLLDQYHENCRSQSDLINIKIAQKIEQGFGRGVRGEKDYCAIIISSLDLISYIRNKKLKNYFSPQTRRQVEIGLEITKMAAADATTDKGWDIFSGLINQLLTRDEGWKEYYIENMNLLESNNSSIKNLLEILELEKIAEQYYSKDMYEPAQKSIQQIVDNYLDEKDHDEKGWYLQEIARMLYPYSKVESNKMQVNAHKYNRSLLRPQTGMVFKKLEINRNRLDNIRDYLKRFVDYNEMKIELLKILSDLSFGIESSRFENALFEIGKILGFESERPDHDWKQGPDNLWNIKKGQYILFECKNEVLSNRVEIYKEETGQMNNSCAWFNSNYGGESVTNVMIIPTKSISKGAGFNEQVKILRKSGLSSLKENITNLLTEFQKFDLHNLSDDQMHSALQIHNLSEEQILKEYFETPYQKN